MVDILLFSVGLIVGGMNAIAGGGSLIGFPVLIATGLSPLVANATGFLVMMPGQVTSAIGYRKYYRNIRWYYILWLVPLVAGAAFGSYILRNTSDTHFENLLPWLILLAVGLFALQPYLHDRLHTHIKSRVKRKQSFILIALALFPLAIYGGYFGPGFGFVLLAFLSFTELNRLHQMNGLKNIAAIAMGTTSVLVLARGGYIHWHSGIIMGLGSLAGGYIGARMAQRFSSHTIRIAVIVIGVTAATYLAFREY